MPKPTPDVIPHRILRTYIAACCIAHIPPNVLAYVQANRKGLIAGQNDGTLFDLTGLDEEYLQ